MKSDVKKLLKSSAGKEKPAAASIPHKHHLEVERKSVPLTREYRGTLTHGKSRQFLIPRDVICAKAEI